MRSAITVSPIFSIFCRIQEYISVVALCKKYSSMSLFLFPLLLLVVLGGQNLTFPDCSPPGNRKKSCNTGSPIVLNLRFHSVREDVKKVQISLQAGPPDHWHFCRAHQGSQGTWHPSAWPSGMPSDWQPLFLLTKGHSVQNVKRGTISSHLSW